MGLELIRGLGLDEFFADVMPRGQETVPSSLSALILIIARLCEPSSELDIAQQRYSKTACRTCWACRPRGSATIACTALDPLLPHNEALEAFLKNRLGKLFDREYDLLLYDVAVRRSVFERNQPCWTADVTTVEHLVETMEGRYGQSDRIWVKANRNVVTTFKSRS